MTKKNSKFLSLLLAAVMALSMAMTGFAASITINNSSEGETYSAYKIFDVTTDTSGKVTGYSYTIDSESPWYNVVSAATDVFTLNQSGDSTIYYVTVNDGADDEDVIAVFTKAVANEDVDLSKIDADGSALANSAGTATITDLEPGYYFITTSLGSLVMINTADDALEINEKNDVPSAEKYILEDEEQEKSESSDNNKTVTYVLYANGVKGAVNLVIHDQMTVDDGITYEFDYDNMIVGLYDASGNLIEDLGIGTSSNYYTFENPTSPDEGEETACDFHIIFNSDAAELFASCGEGSYVMVTISCTLDAGGAGFSDDEEDIKNGEKLSYGNSGDSEWDYVDVYEYGFEIYKYTIIEGNEEDEKVPLSGAEFELTNTSGEKAYFKYNSTSNTYVLEGWLAEGETVPSDYTTTITTDENGKANIEGLNEGTYTLTETKAPDGYNKLDDAIAVTITADETDPSQFTVEQDDTPLSNKTVNIRNNAGTKLPGTGGMGTTIFYIVGVVLIICAAAALIAKRRLDKQN